MTGNPRLGKDKYTGSAVAAGWAVARKSRQPRVEEMEKVTEAGRCDMTELTVIMLAFILRQEEQ